MAACGRSDGAITISDSGRSRTTRRDELGGAGTGAGAGLRGDAGAGACDRVEAVLATAGRVGTGLGGGADEDRTGVTGRDGVAVRACDSGRAAGPTDAGAGEEARARPLRADSAAAAAFAFASACERFASTRSSAFTTTMIATMIHQA
ncbi:MAG: hypothetical protein FJ253_01010 [Phycisphaerae bacterium]|nr:hypothetical protein [Phycisphaerae bacterium]